MVVGVSRQSRTVRVNRVAHGRLASRLLPAALAAALAVPVLGAGEAAAAQDMGISRADATVEADERLRTASAQEVRYAVAQDRPLSEPPRFRYIDMVTTIGDEGFTRQITYTYRTGYGFDGSERPPLDAFFADLEAAGFAVTGTTEDAYDLTWTLEFAAATTAELAELTGVALRSRDTRFEVTTGFDEYDPATRVLRVEEDIDCSAIAELASMWVRDELIVPDEYGSPWGDDNVAVYLCDGPEWYEFRQPVLFDPASFVLALGEDGELTFIAQFFADAEAVAAVGPALADLIAWQDGDGEVDVDETDEGTTYTVTIRGDDETEFLRAFRDWSEDGFLASVEMSDLEDAGPSYEHFQLTAELPFSWALGDHLAEDDLHVEVIVPDGWSAVDDEPLDTYATLSVNAEIRSGPAVDDASRRSGDGSGGGGGGFLLFLAITVAILFLAFRKRGRDATGERTRVPGRPSGVHAAPRQRPYAGGGFGGGQPTWSPTPRAQDGWPGTPEPPTDWRGVPLPVPPPPAGPQGPAVPPGPTGPPRPSEWLVAQAQQMASSLPPSLQSALPTPEDLPQPVIDAAASVAERLEEFKKVELPPASAVVPEGAPPALADAASSVLDRLADIQRVELPSSFTSAVTEAAPATAAASAEGASSVDAETSAWAAGASSVLDRLNGIRKAELPESSFTTPAPDGGTESTLLRGHSVEELLGGIRKTELPAPPPPWGSNSGSEDSPAGGQ